MLIDRRFRKARVWSNRELRKISHLFQGDVINVSARKDSDKQGDIYKNYFSNARSYTISNYGSELSAVSCNEIGLDLARPLPAESCGKYDVVFNHTTLEHVFEVRTAFKNLCDLSRDIVILVLPFSQAHHQSQEYDDYWRFTPSVISAMFAESNMRVLYTRANNDKNCAIYLMSIATHNYESWKDMICERADSCVVGEVIGKNLVTSAAQSIVNMFRKWS
jgi:hypothetical protein